MDAADIFGNIVILAVGGIMLIAVLGGDPSSLINVLPQIIIFALILGLTVTFLRIIVKR